MSPFVRGHEQQLPILRLFLLHFDACIKCMLHYVHALLLHHVFLVVKHFQSHCIPPQ